MKKVIRYIVLLFLALTLVAPSIFSYNEIESISSKVVIDELGNAYITQIWKGSYDSGTELYLPYSNLPNGVITDFSVRENGVLFENDDNWDSSRSREEKKYKSGIADLGGGSYELIFGLGDYGYHEYELGYTIPGMVFNTSDDEQMLFFKFILNNMDPAPKRASVEISAPFVLDKDSVKIWGFGYEGDIITEDGVIRAVSNDSFSSDSHMTVMAKFEGKPFMAANSVDRSSDEIIEQSFEDSSYNYDEYTGKIPQEDEIADYNRYKSGFGRGIFNVINRIIPLFFGIGVVSVIIGLIKSGSSTKRPNAHADAPKYVYDNPFDEHFDRYYALLKRTGEDKLENLLAAYTLKAIYDGYLTPCTNDKTLLGFVVGESRDYMINRNKLNYDMQNLRESEREIYTMFVEAARDDDLLTEKEIKKYFAKKYEKVNSWVNEIVGDSETHLLRCGYLASEERKFLFIPYTTKIITDEGETFIDAVNGFKNYLKDYSLLSERTSEHVYTWDQYMIIAALLGIAEEVLKQFEIANPEAVRSMRFDYGTIYFVNSISRSASLAHRNAQSASSSSGYGGHSSFGGGGGSFGGGGGGGVR